MNILNLKKNQLYSKLREVSEWLYIFLTTFNGVEKYVKTFTDTDNCILNYNFEILYLFDADLQLINDKIMIKNKLKDSNQMLN